MGLSPLTLFEYAFYNIMFAACLGAESCARGIKSFGKKYGFYDDIEKMLADGKDDEAILTALRASAATEIPPKSDGRELDRVHDLDTLGLGGLKPLVSTHGFLDVGSMEGKITAAVAAYYSVPPSLAHACDIVALNHTPSAFTFTQTKENEPIPYTDGKFALVTAFMSAHHYSNPGLMFSEMRRVLRPGGALLLREHDCLDPGRALYYDLTHIIYASVLPPGGGYDDTPRAALAAPQNRGRYRSLIEWKDMLLTAGFRATTMMYKNDKFDSFYMVLN